MPKLKRLLVAAGFATASHSRRLRNCPAAETLLAEPGAAYLPGRHMLGPQGEYVEKQLLHRVRGVDTSKSSGRSGMLDH